MELWLEYRFYSWIAGALVSAFLICAITFEILRPRIVSFLRGVRGWSPLRDLSNWWRFR